MLFEKQNYQSLNLNKTYEKIPKTNNFMDESIVDDIVKQEDDFKLLIKYV